VTDYVIVHRTVRQQPFDKADQQMFEAFLPTISRCIRLHANHGRAQALFAAVNAGIDASSVWVTASLSKPPRDRSAVLHEADTLNQKVRSLFTPPERSFFKLRPLRVPLQLIELSSFQHPY